MFKRHKHTIKREFFVTSFFSALVVSILFIVLISISIYYFSVENAKQKLLTANLHLATYTEGLLETLAVSVRTNSKITSIMYADEGDYAMKREALEILKATKASNPQIKYAYVGYEDGSILIEDYTPPSDFDARLRPWYKSAVDRYPRLSIGLPYQDINDGEWLISVALALVDENQVLHGVMAVDCSLESIEMLMNSISYFDSQVNYVVGASNVIYVHQEKDYLFQNTDDLVEGLSEQFSQQQGLIYYNAFGDYRMAYYHKLQAIGWIVVTRIDYQEVWLPIVQRLTVIILSLILLAVILGILQSAFYERRFVRPISTLKERITEIVSEKPVSSAVKDYVYSNGELEEIARSIEALAETSLRKKANELRLILDSTSDGILVLDLEGKVIHVNDRYKAYWSDLLSKIHNKETYNSILSKNEETATLLRVDNNLVLEEFSYPVIENGLMKGKLWRYRDVTEQVNAQENLKLLATTDSLTGLWNRRYFMERGEFEVNIVKRTGLPLSLLFIDCDFFKTINDTYGHGVGDKILKRAAAVLKTHVRGTDIVTRLGGEEFCILAPNTSLESAGILAEKLRSYFESAIFEVDGETIQFTISIGVSTYSAEVDGIDGLLVQADKACYRAKDEGRNRVCLY